MDARNNIANDLFYKVRSRFSGLKLGNETGQITINPDEARFFDFDYMEGENPIGHVSISLAEPNSMKVYFSHGITEGMDDGQKDNWYGFLRELRSFAKRRLLNFDTRDIAKDNLDQRDYAFLSQNAQPKPTQSNTIQTPVGESIMSESAMYGTKTVSYQKLEDTRLIIKHSQALADDMAPGARSRNISGLFVENADGERFKYPFIHLAGARAMQRHVANGGKPYDEIGESIINMSEEIAQLKSFGNYVVRNDLMNSDTNEVVERSGEQLNRLREQVKALSKQSHYAAYKESFQAQQPLEVPQEFVEDFTEKFTVRNFKEDIKSVFPVLYRLMKEGNTIGYDDIVAMTTTTEDYDDSEISEYNEDFDKFESWVMNLGEESGITSQDPEQQQASIEKLQQLVGQHFPAGVDGSNAIDSLKGIIEDPELFKRIKAQASEDPDSCVRGLVKGWLELNAPEALEQLDFGDYVDDADMDGQADVDAEEEPVEQEGFTSFGDKHTGAHRDNFELWITTNGLYNYEDELLGYFDKFVDGGGSPSAAGQQAVETWKTRMKKDGESVRKPEEEASDANHPEYDKQDDYDLSPAQRGKGTDKYRLPDTKKHDDRHARDFRKRSGQKESMDVQELAEFIHSFYDRESGTFPKGPEGVATMVGKKYGEQAEHVARKMVERMAPQQSSNQNPELAELARIKELSGIRM